MSVEKHRAKLLGAQALHPRIHRESKTDHDVTKSLSGPMVLIEHALIDLAGKLHREGVSVTILCDSLRITGMISRTLLDEDRDTDKRIRKIL